MLGGSGEIVAFISALRSLDNDQREAAEKRLDQLEKTQPWVLTESIFQVINENRVGVEDIQYSFVILKHIFSKIASYTTSKNKRKFANAVSGANLNGYGQILINYLVLISKQSDEALRMNVIRCVATFAEIILSQGPWPALMQTISSFVLSNSLDAQTVGALLCDELASMTINPLMNIIDGIVELINAVSSKPIHTFKASVLRIFSNIYSSLTIAVSTKKPIYRTLVGMVGIYWRFLQAALEEGDTESCGEIISSVITLLQCRTKLCTEDLLNGFSFMTNIVSSGPNVPSSLKKTAMSLFLMYAKNFTKQLFYPNLGASPHSSPTKKKVQYVNTNINENLKNVERVVEILVTWCSDIPDNESWVTEDPESDDGDDEENKYKPDGSKYLFKAGQDMLDSLALTLGYKIMFGILKNLTPRLLISPEWRARSTACIMYCICVEGLGSVPEGLETVKEANMTLTNDDIIQIVSWVCSLVNDPHPRVRWAVAQTLGQMCVDLSPKAQQLSGKLIIETLHKLMDDAPSPNVDLSLISNCTYSNRDAYFARPSFRVVAHSAASLGNFYTEAKIVESVAGKQNYVVASIEASLDKISRLMATDNLFIQKNCITTLGSIANTSSTFFVSKYSIFIKPCLVQLEKYLKGELVEGQTKRPFAHQLIETISLMGHAVGPEVFKNDGITFMNMLINYRIIGEGCLSNQSLLRSALFKAMTNVNNSMGRYLQQNHINAMMMTVCDTFKSDLSVATVVDDDDLDDDDDDDDCEVYNIGGMKMRYNTAIIEEIEDASELLELLLSDHFIETSPFYNTVLELSLNVLVNRTMTMTEFALTNILNIVKAIKHLISCIKSPEKNETGLAITVTPDNINAIQQTIYTSVLPHIIELLPEFDIEINSSAICIDILRSFIFSAPQYLIGPDPAQNKNTIEEYFVKPLLSTYESITNYIKEVVDNEEGDYDEPFIVESQEEYCAYMEIIGLALASGFGFVAKNPNYDFISIYKSYFNTMVNQMAVGMSKEERDEYFDARSAACIVGQNIVKLPGNMINSVPELKNTLANVVIASLQILSESLTIKGTNTDSILPPSSYPIIQAGYYTLKCIISRSENIAITTEIFEYVAKQNRMGGAWEVLDYIVDCCMKFTKLCVSDGNSIDPEIQISYDNAASCWFSCSLFGASRYGKYFVDCLCAMKRICEDSIEIGDIVKAIHRMFMNPSSDVDKQYVSMYAAQILTVLITLICNNVVRYSLRPSVVGLAKTVLRNAQSSDPNGFVAIVKSINNPIIEADIIEFLKA